MVSASESISQVYRELVHLMKNKGVLHAVNAYANEATGVSFQIDLQSDVFEACIRNVTTISIEIAQDERISVFRRS